MEALPLAAYTTPCLGEGPLNLATALHPEDNPTDLGPKTYIAYGREEEADGEGDSVTKLHLDMTDAINLMTHVQYKQVEGKMQKAVVRAGDEEWDKPR